MQFRIENNILLEYDFRNQVFEKCTELQTVYVGSGVIRLREYFFRGCQSLEHLELPGGLERIGDPVPARPVPDAEELKRFKTGMDRMKTEIYAAHNDGGIDIETYVYLTPGEYSMDGRRLLVHTKTVEEDVSPWRPSPAEYVWYGAGVLDDANGEAVYLDEKLFYSGQAGIGNERHHGVSLDHSGSRLLEYGNALTVRSIPEGRDVKKLAAGEFVYADFMEDDRYVLCIDTHNCLQVIDTDMGEVLIKQTLPHDENG